MDASRIAAVVQPLGKELVSVPAALAALRQAYETDDTLGVDAARVHLRDVLYSAQSNKWVPSWLRIVELIGGRNVHGSKLWLRIAAIVENTDYRRDHVAMLIGGVQSDVQTFLNIIRGLDAALQSAGIGRHQVPAWQCEIGALFPENLFTIDDLTRELHELDRHLRTFAELGGTTGGLPVLVLQTGSFDIFVLANPIVGAIVAGVLAGTVKLLKELAEIRKLQAETKKINAEAADLLGRQAATAKEKGLQEITRGALAQAVTTDAARSNELAIATRQSVVYVESKVHVNVVFEVRMSEADTSAERPKDAGENAAVEQISTHGNALAELDSQRAVPLLGMPAQSTKNGT